MLFLQSLSQTSYLHEVVSFPERSLKHWYTLKIAVSDIVGLHVCVKLIIPKQCRNVFSQISHQHNNEDIPIAGESKCR